MPLHCKEYYLSSLKLLLLNYSSAQQELFLLKYLSHGKNCSSWAARIILFEVRIIRHTVGIVRHTVGIIRHTVGIIRHTIEVFAKLKDLLVPQKDFVGKWQ